MATKIYNVTDLQNMQNDLAGDYELANDIDASATSGWNEDPANPGTYFGFEPIGSQYIISEFTGSFNGRGYSINDLFINRGKNFVGIFGCTDQATLQDYTIANMTASGWSYVGCVVGYGYRSAIENIYVTGATIKCLDSGGCFAGTLYDGSADGCSAQGILGALDTDPQYDLGGFVGYNHSTLNECWANVIITAVDDPLTNEIGGFVGLNTRIIRNSYSRSSVTGNDKVGGFAGANLYGNALLENDFSTGLVTGNTNVGGLCGQTDNNATTTDCFWDTTTSGQATSAGGTGKTTAEMKLWATFEGWNITAHTVDIDGYPYLAWQLTGNSPVWYIYEAAKYGPVEIVALEALRNIEMSAMGRIYVDEEGNLCYENRYARQL